MIRAAVAADEGEAKSHKRGEEEVTVQPLAVLAVLAVAVAVLLLLADRQIVKELKDNRLHARDPIWR